MSQHASLMSAASVIKTPSVLAAEVEKIVHSTPVFDIHTHLYDPAFGGLLLCGIDDLLVYHYLVAEGFRYWDIPFESFWKMTKEQQAERIWDSLFIQNSPVSESCRGVVTTLNALGLEAKRRDLRALREWFAAWKPEEYVSRVLDLAGVRTLCMSNSPFDPVERAGWGKGFRRDERFAAGLRIEPILLNWRQAVAELNNWGYAAQEDLSGHTIGEVRRFLEDWTKRIHPLYLMASLPPDFAYPAKNAATRLLEEAVLPHCADHGLPFALMPGVRRAVNPALSLAGDGVELTNLNFVRDLCAGHPQNRFLMTVLARENQHEACVLARKFRNLHLFGCWWFTNIPLLIEEITRMRFELLGLSFTPQHSDARVLDQLIYKWQHSRGIIAKTLSDKYTALVHSGWELTRAEIERDVQGLLGGNFEKFCRA